MLDNIDMDKTPALSGGGTGAVQPVRRDSVYLVIMQESQEKGRAEDEPMHDGEFNAYKIRLQTPCGLHRPAGERALLGPPMLKAIFAATFLLAQALRQAHQAIGAARAMELALFEKCILQVIRSGFFHERQYYRFHLQYKPATFDKHLFLFYIWHK